VHMVTRSRMVATQTERGIASVERRGQSQMRRRLILFAERLARPSANRGQPEVDSPACPRSRLRTANLDREWGLQGKRGSE